jgi:selenide,water dikinase
VYGVDAVGDAGVYSIDEKRSLVQTVDVLTPIADDPATFGEIAAANSLSDVYALGGAPLTALNIVGWPSKLDISILGEILEGGSQKVREADAVIIGGHTIKDSEVKYGLSVTGIIETDRVVTMEGAKPGDSIILTKRIGTGVISTALKNEKASPEAVSAINDSMRALNRRASELMMDAGAHACTDITGFSLLGHALVMAEKSKVGLRINSASVPFFEWAPRYAEEGHIPGGTRANFDFVKPKVDYSGSVSEPIRVLLCDAQTSGGLLIAVGGGSSASLLNALRSFPETSVSEVIGEVVEGHSGRIRVE